MFICCRRTVFVARSCGFPLETAQFRPTFSFGTGIAQAVRARAVCLNKPGRSLFIIYMANNLKSPKTNAKTSAPAPEPPKFQPAAPMAAAPAARPQSPRSPGPARVSLQLVNPTAKKVCVAGSFNGWKPEATPLSQTGNGQWTGDLAVKPGRHEYLFVVDGQWLPDPKARESVANPFGGRNSVLIVAE